MALALINQRIAMAKRKDQPSKAAPKTGVRESEKRFREGGWQKPVKPPKQDSRPGGLPPKKKSSSK
jgi:hypothetical protein